MDITNKFCHNCGTKQQPTAKFCSSCGTSLASIDEKPPGSQPRLPLGRVQQQPANTFEPSILGAGGGRRIQDDDDDDNQIRADRVESLAELGIRLNGLELYLDVPAVQKESFANVVKGGMGFPQGYQEAPRHGMIPTADSVKNIMQEGAAIRPGSSSTITVKAKE